MVQFLSIIFFSWISSIFVGFSKSSGFFVSLCINTHFRIKLLVLTYFQEDISQDHKDPDRYLFTAHCVRKINGNELVPGMAIT